MRTTDITEFTIPSLRHNLMATAYNCHVRRSTQLSIRQSLEEANRIRREKEIKEFEGIMGRRISDRKYRAIENSLIEKFSKIEK